MPFDVQVPTVTAINSERLHEDIAAVVPTFIGIRNMSGSVGITLVFQNGALQFQIDTAIIIAEAHNPADLSTGEQAVQTVATHKADVKARYLVHALKNKTPTQIYTYIEGQIDGWNSLADAKTDLHAWLPLIGAAIAWAVMEADDLTD